MKRILKLAFWCIAAIAVLSSCSKDERETPEEEDSVIMFEKITCCSLLTKEYGMRDEIGSRIVKATSNPAEADVIFLDSGITLSYETCTAMLESLLNGGTLFVLDIAWNQLDYFRDALLACGKVGLDGKPALISDSQAEILKQRFSVIGNMSEDNTSFGCVAINLKHGVMCMKVNLADKLASAARYTNRCAEFIEKVRLARKKMDAKSDLDASSRINSQWVRVVRDYHYISPENMNLWDEISGGIIFDYYIQPFYSFNENRDYYVVNMVANFENDRIYRGPDNESKWCKGKEGGDDADYYGSFFARATIQPHCVEASFPKLLDASPKTGIGSTQTSTNVSHTIGGNIGVSIAENPGLNLGINASKTFQTGTSENILDLTVTQNTTANQEPTWHYEAALPEYLDSHSHEICKPILRNNMTLEQNWIWAMDNTANRTSAYQIYSTIQYQTAYIYYHPELHGHLHEVEEKREEHYIYMSKPARSYQTDWTMQIIKLGDLSGDIQNAAIFTNYLTTNFTTTWKPEYEVYDYSDKDDNSGLDVFHEFKKAFFTRAQKEMRTLGYTGEFSFVAMRGQTEKDRFTIMISADSVYEVLPSSPKNPFGPGGLQPQLPYPKPQKE